MGGIKDWEEGETGERIGIVEGSGVIEKVGSGKREWEHWRLGVLE